MKQPLVVAILAACALAVAFGCTDGEDQASDSTSAPDAEEPAIFEPWNAGLDFLHHTGTEGSLAMPGIMGGGAAVFDYDGDGHLDLYFVQSGETFPGASDTTGQRSPNRLYRQTADGQWQDVTEASGAGDTGYGMGAAVADIDNDGDLDLLVTNFGRDTLLRNEGDGTFRDVTAEYGVGTTGWSMSAVFFDYDRDGWLDLYVTRYVRFETSKICRLENGRPEYCGPTAFPGVHDVLYQNLAGRSFRDVTAEAGIEAVAEAGLGVVAADWNDDGWVDLYVANDADPNNLWVNNRNGTFSDQAILLGVANNRLGAAEAGMGVATADLDNNGHLDLFVTHLIEESNTFYENLGGDGFVDMSAAAGLAGPSFDLTGFGTATLDYDNDGDLDLALVNGAVKRRARPLGPDSSWFLRDYAEPNLLFENRGDGRFDTQCDPESTRPFCRRHAVSRGLIAADLDADGDQDLIVTNLEGEPELYRNVGAQGNWIELRLVLPAQRREAFGALVVIESEHSCQTMPVGPGSGYLTVGPATVHVGLGVETATKRFLVRWPDGSWESFDGTRANQAIELARASGQAITLEKGERPCA